MTANGLIRHQQRHLHKTLCDYIRNGLVTVGWIGSSPPFGATAVTFMEIQPEENGIAPAPNTVAVTMGKETAFTEQELGAGLTGVTTDLFVDVYGEDLSTAVAIASDIRDGLSWLVTPLRDYSLSAAGIATGTLIDVEDVFIDVPPAAMGRTDKRFWRVLTAAVSVNFVDDRVGVTEFDAAASCAAVSAASASAA